MDRPSRSTHTALRVFVLCAGLTLVTAACGQKPTAYGDANALIVVTPEAVWWEVEDTLKSALAPEIFTVRDEETYRITHQDPTARFWDRLQRFRQLILIGTAEDPWVARALEEVPEEEMRPAPALIRTGDVWSAGQNVWILLVGDHDEVVAEVGGLLTELHETLDQEYRAWVRNRMYVSGRDTTLADTLRNEYGFSMLLPDVYGWASRDSVLRFRNDNPDPSELIREVLVTWRTPIPDELPSVDSILAWRARLAEQYYPYPQQVDTTRLEASPATFRDQDAFVLQSVWENPPGDAFPAAGPFMTRLVTCPSQDRLYFIDAWLYAPGKDKYQYMLQLEYILNSFRCGEASEG